MNILLSVYIKERRRSVATLKVLMYAIRKKDKLFAVLIQEMMHRYQYTISVCYSKACLHIVIVS